MLKINDRYEVTILKQDHFGKGLTKINDIFIFVDNALTGDVCEIVITSVKKKFATAKIEKIIKSSTDRVVPECPYYDICGGCHIMHEDYNKQLQFKENKVRELLSKFTGLEKVKNFPILGGNCFYYRNKVVFHGQDKQLGFYKEKTNILVPIEKCIITDNRLNEVYYEINKFLLANPDNKIDDLMLRVTSLNEILVTVSGKINKDKLLSYLKEVTSVYINGVVVKGKEYIEEDILGIKFKIYPTSFFQVNYDMMLKLYGLVIDFYKKKNYQKVLDLYCGTGTIGMLISSYVKEVVGVEKEHSSIVSANLCKEVNGISNISFIEGKVEDKIDLFKDVDSIIVDPPRSGLDNHSLDIIMKLEPKTITYISCDPVTLARDLKILLKDYEVLEIHPVDMFPNTYHVENVIFLEKKQQKIFDNYMVLVNKNNIYEESDFDGIKFVEIYDIEGNKILVEEVTYNNYLEFKDKLKELGIEVTITSGYRSLEEQRKTIEELSVVYKDNEELYKKVAPVGASEHHTGLALDITISDKKQYQERFEKYYTEEELQIRENKYQIMAEICSDFGFILRYPKDKVDITGYSYEPWHFRYIGRDIAKLIMNKKITLEEYLKEEI